MDGIPLKVTRRCAYEQANIVSKILFLWAIPLFIKGYREVIDYDDLFICPKEDSPEVVAKLFEKELDIEVDKWKSGEEPHIDLARVMVRVFGWDYFKRGNVLFWVDCVLKLVQPFMVGNVVSYLSSGMDDPNQKMSAAISIIIIIITTVIISLGKGVGFFQTQRLGNNMRTVLTAVIYKKLLKLSQSSLTEADMGRILNVLTNDLSRFEEFSFTWVMLVSAPVAALACIFVSWYHLGVSSLGGTVLLLLFIPLQGWMARMFKRFRRRTIDVTDRRVRLMNELISAMKLIKFFCWEIPFSGKVKQIREEEIKTISNSYMLRGINIALSFVGTRLMLFFSFVIYVLSGNQLTAEKVFVVMSVYNAARTIVTKMFPEAVSNIAEIMVAIKRVVSILEMEEKPVRTKDERHPIAGTVEVNKYSAKWNESIRHESLKEINFSVSPGDLTIIVGAVGSGKTCLLLGLLKEIHCVEGSTKLGGTISYAPQESWVFGGSVRDNILLGKPMNWKRYREVIRACGLQRDLSLFNEGDLSFVGERGYTLSGGQKARLSLARAVYNESDIYILDDPLSAVDPKVGRHIFDECIQGFLKGKTVILVTHQLHFLTSADQVVVMDAGRCQAKGSYSDLMTGNNEFFSFIRKKEEEDRMKQTSGQSQMIPFMIDEGNENESSNIEGDEEQNLINSEKKKDDREEGKGHGSLSWSVYWYYVKMSKSFILPFGCFVCVILSQFIYSFTDLWLSAWTDMNNEKTTNATEVHPEEIKGTSALSMEFLSSDQGANALIYTLFMVVLFVLSFAKTWFMFVFCLKSSINIHDRVFIKVLRSKMSFFETNPTGRILNRFTKDLGTIDSNLPLTFTQVADNVCISIGIVVVSIVVNYWMLIPVILLVLCSIPIARFYVRTSREVQRLDSISRSPVYGHISSTIEGITTIRAFEMEENFNNQYFIFLKDSVSCRFTWTAANRVIALILDTLTNLYIVSICILLLFIPEGSISGGDAGLILSSSLLLIGTFQLTIRMVTNLENQMVSCERVFEYNTLDQEDDAVKEGVVSSLWPSKGSIEFSSVSMRYSPSLPYVLEEVSFQVKSSKKIGVVGRTGAGKSSLISCIFRLIELEEGKIMIDGMNIRNLGLDQLRDKISIIPQDPSLFSGSVRLNLDPFKEYSDSKIWSALENANLAPKIRSIDGGLDGQLAEGGSNLSVGQRQLLCLARALLKDNRILILDEATANVDQETDEFIQKTLRNKCVSHTVITVAHRLNTIIDMDKVLVMDAGKVIEYDAPHVLLKNLNGMFSSMVRHTGPEFERMLHTMAEEAYFKNQIIED